MQIFAHGVRWGDGECGQTLHCAILSVGKNKLNESKRNAHIDLDARSLSVHHWTGAVSVSILSVWVSLFSVDTSPAHFISFLCVRFNKTDGVGRLCTAQRHTINITRFDRHSYVLNSMRCRWIASLFGCLLSTQQLTVGHVLPHSISISRLENRK